MNQTSKIQTKVSVIGLGNMGYRLAEVLLQKGYEVTVWNRNIDKAAPLVENGVVAASTAAEAVSASELVVICVLNYEVLEKIVKPLAKELKGKTLISLTNDTPRRARQMAAWAAEQGIDYLDGSVLVPVPVVGDPEALLLYSGAKAVFDRYLSVLKALGGKSTYLGEEPGRAALYDMAMMNIFFTSLSGLLHSYALLEAEGVSAREFLPYAKEIFSLSDSLIGEFAEGVDKQYYPGDLDNIRMEAAGIAHIIHASKDAGIETGVLESLKAVYDRAIKAGFGDNSMVSAIEGIKRPGNTQEEV